MNELYKVRICEGNQFASEVMQDGDWPYIPRAGEFITISYSNGKDDAFKITVVEHIVSSDEEFIGTRVFVERSF